MNHVRYIGIHGRDLGEIQSQKGRQTDGQTVCVRVRECLCVWERDRRLCSYTDFVIIIYVSFVTHFVVIILYSHTLIYIWMYVCVWITRKRELVDKHDRTLACSITACRYHSVERSISNLYKHTHTHTHTIQYDLFRRYTEKQ